MVGNTAFLTVVTPPRPRPAPTLPVEVPAKVASSRRPPVLGRPGSATATDCVNAPFRPRSQVPRRPPTCPSPSCARTTAAVRTKCTGSNFVSGSPAVGGSTGPTRIVPTPHWYARLVVSTRSVPTSARSSPLVGPSRGCVVLITILLPRATSQASAPTSKAQKRAVPAVVTQRSAKSIAPSPVGARISNTAPPLWTPQSPGVSPSLPSAGQPRLPATTAQPPVPESITQPSERLSAPTTVPPRCTGLRDRVTGNYTDKCTDPPTKPSASVVPFVTPSLPQPRHRTARQPVVTTTQPPATQPAGPACRSGTPPLGPTTPVSSLVPVRTADRPSTQPGSRAPFHTSTGLQQPPASLSTPRRQPATAALRTVQQLERENDRISQVTQ